jgi:hypothetical protein
MVNKKQKYRHLRVDFVETPTLRHTVGVILQEAEEDNTGRCFVKFREDRTFLNKVLSVRFANQPPDQDWSYGDVLIPAAERLNKELARDLRIEVIDETLIKEGRSEEDSVRIKPIKPGDPSILEQLRERQPRIDPEDPKSAIVFPYFEFTEWENLASKEHVTLVLSKLVKEIENEG